MKKNYQEVPVLVSAFADFENPALPDVVGRARAEAAIEYLDSHFEQILYILNAWPDEKGIGLGPKLKNYIILSKERQDLAERIVVMSGQGGNTVDQLIALAPELKKRYGTRCRLLLITNRRHALRVWATTMCLGFAWGWIQSNEKIITPLHEDVIGLVVNFIDPFWKWIGQLLRLATKAKERRHQAIWRNNK